MKAVKISEHVYWVGVIDWNLREFHGYSTKRGSTYNSYLIMAEKPTLVETVKAPFKDEMLERIASVIDPKDIKYIVSGHAEMDHSGSIPHMIDLIKPEKVVASTMGVKALQDHFHLTHPIIPVKDGDTLSLGNMELKFLETRMIHWPDSMFSYLAKDELLFSQDAFGMHLASSERFADEVAHDVRLEETAKYYANIILPYSSFVLKLIERWKGINLNVKFIATDHGPIWRDGGAEIIPLYEKWALQKPEKKAVIIYDTMWKSTEAMANEIAGGLIEEGVETVVLPLAASSRSDVALHVLSAGAVFIGSPTLNNNIFPSVADSLVYLKGLRPKNKIGAAFGSYGWGGEALEQLNQWMKDIGIELVSDGVKVKYVPREEDLVKCFELGRDAAARLKELV
ncbi:MAG: MBL fold metallo-hydrolase [Deltaproteobacteria bacterium CG11_big_fil_rev_8_21_14_0_20_49_13]|nr:MAG: MBL fold metallo-hydrolase [Deltaproteobacteria bacterium CG11_big_fil_rev_8_21_14_0_20_49_13]